ncbi:3-dehydroquinate synthase [Terriglobus tenax]|uniref:3-dehydroquinate synthase n=1 Tax=Terriglobus tenax TaxID=1111115 RepID=UPI0021E04F93|nr:3-dehydroquinate synthase [Terriglobus tenax]
MPVIPVNTPTANYNVVIGRGLLPTLSRRILKLTGSPATRLFVVTTPEIWTKWKRKFLASFPKDAQPVVLLHPSGESHKRFAAVESLLEQLAENKADRDSVLVAFGGGVIGDITGFLAAIYMRGIRFIQVPTTLLAQVDSSVGGKTGVNLRAGKNLVGSFHQPLGVFVDIDVLKTLPANELRAGLQESVKAGVIRMPRLFRFMESDAKAILKGDPKALEKVVTSSVKMKAEVVGIDERENGLRMILNFGHTIGHAIEAATKYKQLLHGEAIAWGMIAATLIAVERGLLAEADATRIVNTVLAYGPVPKFRAPAEQIVALTGSDKKNRSGERRFILPSAIGKVEIVTDVTEAEMLHATRQTLKLMQERGA